MNLKLGTIVLHPRMAWVNEFTRSRVLYDTQITLTGHLLVQYGLKQGGIPIQLKGGPATRELLTRLHALQEQMECMPLRLQDGRMFDVVFAGSEAIKINPIGMYHAPTVSDLYELEINLVSIIEE